MIFSTRFLLWTPQRSSLKGVPLFGLQGELTFNPKADPFQNEALVQMWIEVKIKPLLKSVTKNFLTCLSAKSFSCHTYQIMYVWVSVYLHVSVTFVRTTYLTFLSLLAGWRSSVTIILRCTQSDKSGSTHSLCTPFCPETESLVKFLYLCTLTFC